MPRDRPVPVPQAAQLLAVVVGQDGLPDPDLMPPRGALKLLVLREQWAHMLSRHYHQVEELLSVPIGFNVRIKKILQMTAFDSSLQGSTFTKG